MHTDVQTHTPCWAQRAVTSKKKKKKKEDLPDLEYSTSMLFRVLRSFLKSLWSLIFSMSGDTFNEYTNVGKNAYRNTKPETLVTAYMLRNKIQSQTAFEIALTFSHNLETRCLK